MKRLTKGMIFLLLVLFMVACSKEEPKEVQEEPVEVDQPPEKEVYVNSYPLTGLEKDDEAEYRAFGVMIENSHAARPQSGLYQADLVYEVLSEATITRLLAFFHSEKPEIIGPVRSARDYYIHLNNGYKGIYVSAGGSPQAIAMFDEKKVDFISGLKYDGRFFSRSSARKAPHNMYTSYEDLLKATENEKYSLEAEVPTLPFLEADIVLDGEKALQVSINYGSDANNVIYEYDLDQKKYIRIVGEEQSVDLETENPVLIDNIFIVEMSHEILDKQGRRAIDISSGGDGFLIQNGVYQAVQWKNVDGQILPFKNDQSLGFLRGKTWINVVPELNSKVSIQ
ncbi:MAG: DUF3048 domain-containing protein [Anaerobacillus sp.]|uniref:DUF3048 domain-containing protein n=1 Tax=Anaerobacillus sp. TaxID=1872506 RepID=UPI00391A7ADC